MEAFNPFSQVHDPSPKAVAAFRKQLNCSNMYGQTALMLACKNGWVQRGAEPPPPWRQQAQLAQLLPGDSAAPTLAHALALVVHVCRRLHDSTRVPDAHF